MYERILAEMALNGFKYASSKKAPKLGLFCHLVRLMGLEPIIYIDI